MHLTAGDSSLMPTTEFQNLHEIIRKARANLGQNDWDYIVGGTESEATVRRNRMALDSLAFRPRVLRNVRHIDASTEEFGRKLRLPILLCPVGGLDAFDPDGAATMVRAAREFGVPHFLSSVCAPGLEAVAQAAPDALRIFQLYVRGDDSFVDGYVRRAVDNGYTGFCVTVDSAVYTRRERDISKRHLVTSRRQATGMEFQAACEWGTIARIRGKFAGPLILKGIATAEDARIAVDHGVDWIFVSNHGGRQLDHGRGTIDILPEIVEAVAGRTKVIVDGSFCRGTDIVKAIARGADLVGIGRMQCYGLAAAGQAGVVRVLEILEDEVERCLGALGVTNVAELDASYLHAAAPTNLPDVLSAFQLLKIDEYAY